MDQNVQFDTMSVASSRTAGVRVHRCSCEHPWFQGSVRVEVREDARLGGGRLATEKAWSVPKTLFTCFSTVFSLTTRLWAMALLERLSAAERQDALLPVGQALKWVAGRSRTADQLVDDLGVENRPTQADAVNAGRELGRVLIRLLFKR